MDKVRRQSHEKHGSLVRIDPEEAYADVSIPDGHKTGINQAVVQCNTLVTGNDFYYFKIDG